MSGGHAHTIDPSRPLDGPIERLAPEVKIVAAVGFVLAVVATPAQSVWAYAVHLAVVGIVAVIALVPLATVARRLVFETPFMLLALAMIVLGGGPTIALGPLGLSEPGLWSAWSVLARATLGVLAASVLAATTTPAELVHGLERLHMPRVITAISAFAVRYIIVLRDELDRMRLAQALRSGGHRARPREVASLGAVLFVRTFERGERVHAAMTTRGRGAVLQAQTDLPSTPSRDWAIAIPPVLIAVAVAAVAWTLR